MDSTPPPAHRSNPNSQTKSASRLARITYSVIAPNKEFPNLSLDLVSSSPKNTPSPSASSLPLQELLLLSPSPLRKSRTRLADRLDMAADEAVDHAGSARRRCKNRGTQMALMGCASPRNNRRSRRRSELEVREDRELGVAEEIRKVRKRRQSVRSKKEKLSLVVSVPSSSSSPKVDDANRGNLDEIGELIYDLVMWRDVAKSSLWFGFGCLSFLSSCFTRGINFSIFSVVSQLGLLFLGASFFSNSFCQRKSEEKRSEFKLREDDILRMARPILPATNLAISKTRDLFSGEPSTTLKVIPFLLLGAEYGHLITLWRLCAFGFFLSFTIPKLYSCYSSVVNQKVESMKKRIMETWGGCSHKKIVAASAVTAFWNLSSVKTRILTAFICIVVIRYSRQHLVPKSGEEEGEGGGEKEQEQKPEEQHAVVVAEAEGSQ
ncbi:reticulon-like protein B17 isoform X2 [Carica papaya]|nr:reticulon-like protein B17 isoform X2 [Carica papaya]